MFHSKFVAFVLLTVAAVKAQPVVPTASIQLPVLLGDIIAEGALGQPTVTLSSIAGEPSVTGAIAVVVDLGPLPIATLSASELPNGNVAVKLN